jgi:hypothetical protein
LPWARGFLLPIATETRAVLLATPFTRLPEVGRALLSLVDFAWERLAGSMAAADGQGWAEA